MKLSDKATCALNTVIDRFRTGDLSPLVAIIKLRHTDETRPSSKWSLGNQVLAYIQTGSLDCRGYRQWETAGRQVHKGTHAAWILGPCTYKRENAQGETETYLTGFHGIPVFADHDTEGDPIDATDYTPNKLPPLVDLATNMGINVSWTPTPSDRMADYSPSKDAIRLGTHDTKTWFHELSHATHARLNGGLAPGSDPTQETIAEFTACVLMELYDLGDRSGNSWRYISQYHTDPLAAIIKAIATIEKVLKMLDIMDTKGD